MGAVSRSCLCSHAPDLPDALSGSGALTVLADLYRKRNIERSTFRISLEEQVAALSRTDYQINSQLMPIISAQASVLMVCKHPCGTLMSWTCVHSGPCALTMAGAFSLTGLRQ